MSDKKYTLKIEITEEEKDHLEAIFMRDSGFIIRQEKACSRKRDYLLASIWKESAELSNVLFLKIIRGLS